MMEAHQQTFGQWLGEIQANGGLFVLGLIFVILGIAFWFYSAMIVRSLKADIEQGKTMTKEWLFNHQKYWHLDNGEPIKLDMQDMIKKHNQERP
jgi:hypothetical protein